MSESDIKFLSDTSLGHGTCDKCGKVQIWVYKVKGVPTYYTEDRQEHNCKRSAEKKTVNDIRREPGGG